MRIVHYLNQFFGGVGGEEKAGMGLEVREGATGPGKLFEQIMDAASLVSELLNAADRLNILVTSRERLHLQAEIEFGVPPLTVPEEDCDDNVDDLFKFDSVRLFVERAKKANSDFELTVRLVNFTRDFGDELVWTNPRGRCELRRAKNCAADFLRERCRRARVKGDIKISFVER